MDAKQIPLIEQLERVPADARLVVDEGDFCTRYIPVGRICHEAAKALRDRLAQTTSDPRAMQYEQVNLPADAERILRANLWELTDGKTEQAEPAGEFTAGEFTAGDTFRPDGVGVGWTSGIHNLPWGNKIECYGSTREEAEALRDRLLLLLNREKAEPVAAVKDSLTPEQSPVAWMCLRSQSVSFTAPTKEVAKRWNWVPVYTAPPTRTPLTDEQIENDWERITGHSLIGGDKSIGRPMHIAPAEVFTFARAIERKHGIGEKK